MSHVCAAVGSTCVQLLASYWSKTTAIRLRWTGYEKDLDGPCSRHLSAILVLWMDTVIHQWNIVKPIHERTQIPKQMPCVPTWLQDLRVLNQPWAMDIHGPICKFCCTNMFNMLQLQWLGLMDHLQETIIYTISPLARLRFLRCDGTTWLWRPASCLQAGLVLTRANQVIPRRWENVSVKSHIFYHDLSIDLSPNIYP